MQPQPRDGSELGAVALDEPAVFVGAPADEVAVPDAPPLLVAVVPPEPPTADTPPFGIAPAGPIALSAVSDSTA